MRMTYRGVTYERDSTPLEMLEGENAGKYRGNDWKYRYPRHIPQLEPKIYRQYRGVSYSTRPVVAGEGVEVPKLACPLPATRPVSIEREWLSTVHLDNIRRRLERRLQIAQENGDENLVELLKKESRDLALHE
ncbi:DUF4278 domain-containing protein [Pannus brasiliensis CCIBt3594]|uniref:DUF4278 domain-containing protein n=1 Tax=Pannus brasiliensis CCIBt3594 TaxID=1427578 RepID=A0AAW9QTE1_9CHRO